MKRSLSAVMLVLAAALSMPSGWAGPRVLSGEVVQDRVVGLTTAIPWCHSLSQAQSVARQEGKMIFWVHMLGKIDGAT